MNENDHLIAMLTASERAIFAALGGRIPRTPPPTVHWNQVPKAPGAWLTRIEKYGSAKRKDLLASRTKLPAKP